MREIGGETSGGETVRLRDGRRLGYAEWGEPEGRPLLSFHGWPSSRAEGRLLDRAAKASGVRVIAPDRPGIGLSDFQPGRTMVDWPGDVEQLVGALGIGRFAVLGLSGGAPYAAVCAWGLPGRVTTAGIVSGIGPLDAPGATEGMSTLNRVLFRGAARLPLVPRVLMGLLALPARRRPGALIDLARRSADPADRAYLDRPEMREALSATLYEAFRRGGRGPA